MMMMLSYKIIVADTVSKVRVKRDAALRCLAELDPAQGISSLEQALAQQHCLDAVHVRLRHVSARVSVKRDRRKQQKRLGCMAKEAY